jgi:hypothetical protein
MLFVLALPGLLSFTACKKEEPTGGHTLQRAKAAWAAAQKSSYTIDQLWVCECIQTQHGNVRITVLDNQITQVTRTADGQPVPEDQWRLFSTVDELLAQAEELPTKTPYRSQVQYDPGYGYPTLISADYSAQVADDEFTIRTSGLSF